MKITNKELYHKLLNIVSEVAKIKNQEPMKNHTTLSVGGEADFLIEPTTVEEIKNIVKLAKEYDVKYYIIGRGSNLLVKDEGLRGIVIKIADNFDDVNIEGTKFVVNSGTSIAKVSKLAYKNGLSGLEFASGIPGTVGGAIAMNAGAYGGEMKDVVKSVTLINSSGDLVTLTNEQMQFSYRRSLLSEKEDYIVVSVEMELSKGDKGQMYSVMKSYSDKRATSQPLHFCNSGSTFKRPQGHFAGKLIEDCGLKGFEYNGVQVSDLHAGFIVNKGKSSASDMLHVINLVKEKVFNTFDIVLEEEVKII